MKKFTLTLGSIILLLSCTQNKKDITLKPGETEVIEKAVEHFKDSTDYKIYVRDENNQNIWLNITEYQFDSLNKNDIFVVDSTK